MTICSKTVPTSSSISGSPSEVSTLHLLAVECTVKLDRAGGESLLATQQSDADLFYSNIWACQPVLTD